MDVELVRQAIMADLGSNRQEELPLSRKQHDGPTTWNPSRRINDRYRVAKSLQKALNANWNDEIHDAESEEAGKLKSLASRPYAKAFAQDFMNRHRSYAAPPPYPSPKQPDVSSRRRIVPAKKDTVTIGRSSRALATLVERFSPKSPSYPSKQAAKAGDPEAPSPSQGLKTVLSGQCKLWEVENHNALWLVSFAMVIRIENNGAFLSFRSQQPFSERIFDIQDVKLISIMDVSCILANRSGDNTLTCKLQFTLASEAKKFILCLETLQKAVAQSLGQKSCALESEFLPTTSTPHPAAATETADLPEATANQHPSDKLIDVESPPVSIPNIASPTIDDAAQKLFELIEKILPEARAAGLILSEDAVDEIQETAIDNWLDRGFLESETDDIKSDLLVLLRVLVRIKHKAESRKRACQMSAAVQQTPLQPIRKGKPSRIQYTAAELEALASPRRPSRTVPVQTIVTPRQPTSAASMNNPNASITKGVKLQTCVNGQPESQQSDSILTPPDNRKMNETPERPCVLAKQNHMTPPMTPSEPRGLRSSR